MKKPMTSTTRRNLPHGMIAELISTPIAPPVRRSPLSPELKVLRQTIREYVKDPHGDLYLRWLYGKELSKAKAKRVLSEHERKEIIERCNEIEWARQKAFGRPPKRPAPDQPAPSAFAGLIGHLYVIEFTSGIIKVGRAMDPQQRLSYHESVAAIHGVEVARQWISGAHSGYIATEATLIRFCESAGIAAFGREYFRNVSFDAARDFAESITGQSGEAS